MRNLIAQAPPNPRLRIYLCARDSARGKAALESLKKDENHEVVLGDLDVGDPTGESVKRFKARLEKDEGKVSSALPDRLLSQTSTDQLFLRI